MNNPQRRSFATYQYLVSLLMMSLVAPFTEAEVIVDGTLGYQGALEGPHYQIGAALGQQQGGHLFHSFSDFNIHTGESATFSGPNTVQNIISRVTGGNPSRINGLLRSTIPEADFYFLNPYGILFGEGAELDVQGSFHASTADRLRFSDGTEFNARTPNNGLLTVAPIEAFGFLTDTPSAISVENSTLSVSEGKTLSLIGGDLHVSSTDLPFYNTSKEKNFNSMLLAESGRINLASIASQGEVVPTKTDMNLGIAMRGGDIIIKNTEINTSHSQGGGRVFIRGGRFELIDSDIIHETQTKNGGIINIQVDRLEQQASIIHEESGENGKVSLKVSETLNLSGNPIFEEGRQSNYGSKIFTVSYSEGKGGHVEIESGEINLVDGAQIGGGTFGNGNGSHITLKVKGGLKVQVGGIFANSGNWESEATGKAGDIRIEADQIQLLEGGQIASGTLGDGQGGFIFIKVNDTLIASGQSKISLSGISVDSLDIEKTGKAGNAGNIEIEAHKILLDNGAAIRSSTYGSGEGGRVTLIVDHLILLKGSDISSKTTGSGNGGTIHIEAPNILISGKIANYNTAIRVDSFSEENNAGNAGKIEIDADKMRLQDDAIISSATWGHGEGGAISIKVTDILAVQYSGIFGNSESTNLNAGKSGNINI